MSEVVEFLISGGLGEPVQQVDTHGAHVFIGRERVWKMKRPVQFRFMDFSMLQQRERVIRQELELNRRTAPSLYLNVKPVVRRPDGHLQVDAPGEPVEWLLEMKRFERRCQLNEMAGRGELQPATVETLARSVAKFHAEAEAVPGSGGHDALAQVIAGNTADLLDLCPAMLAEEDVRSLDRLSGDHVIRHRALLDARRDNGKVRLCHGDLHLGNVVMLDGKPTPFDCLEFDRELATTDVIYDIAFLIMDLLHRGLRPHAQRALQGWIDVCEDDEAVALLPLCLATRAAIRAKVEGLQDNPDAARAYLSLALSFFELKAPTLLALGGVSGTGKTTLARALAPDLGPTPGAVILRSDVIRKRMFGKDAEDRLHAEAYLPEVSAKVFDRINERAGVLLLYGHAAMADAVFGQPDQRQSVEVVAREADVAFQGLWLEAPQATLSARIEARRDDASDATSDVLASQLENIDQDIIDWSRVDVSGDEESALANAKAALRTSG